MPTSCVDWTRLIGRDSETEMNSQSYATLAGVEEAIAGSSSALGLKDTTNDSEYWPFMFDTSYQQSSQKELFHTSSSDIINPSQLEGLSNLTTLPPNEDSFFSNRVDPIHALGPNVAHIVTDNGIQPHDNFMGNTESDQQLQINPMPYYPHYYDEIPPVNQNYQFPDNQNPLWSPEPNTMAHNYWLGTVQNSPYSQMPLQSPILSPHLATLKTTTQRSVRSSKKDKLKIADGLITSPSPVAANDNNGNRRRSAQHIIFCSECDSQIGIAFIRGAFIFSHEQPTNILCKSCTKSEAKTNATIKDEEYDGDECGSKKRKRKEDQKQVVDCEVCHGCIGFGGIAPSCIVDGGEVKAEFLCTDCGDKYMFCSECGGGGKQRTGKWRPKELFENGRRTCSLPHIRVGTAEVHYKVIPVKDLTTEVLQGIQDVFFDCLLSLYCVPTIMMSSKFGTFDAIKAEIEKLWLRTVLDVLTNNVLHGEKFITVAWIQKRHRNKGVGKPNAIKDTKPWLQKLDLSGIISGGLKVGGDEDHQCFVAFSIAEWDISSQSIFLAQMAPRSVFLKTMEGYVDLIKNCVEAIHKRASEASVAKPSHIWCWAKPDHARLQSIPIRLKFMPREDYLSLNPKLNPESFDRLDYGPLHEEGTVIYASSVKPFAPKY